MNAWRVADTSLSGAWVARELDLLVTGRGKPKTVVSDNGSELTSNAILAWANSACVDWHYIAPGKPMQNGFIEGFNGRLRDELLNETLFTSLAQARVALASWHRLQHRSTSFGTRLANAARVRRDLHPATGHGAAPNGQLRDLHRQGNEPAWWANRQIRPLEIVRKLWTATQLQEVPLPIDASG